MQQVCVIADTQIGSSESSKELNYSLAGGYNPQAILVSKSIAGQGLLFTL